MAIRWCRYTFDVAKSEEDLLKYALIFRKIRSDINLRIYFSVQQPKSVLELECICWLWNKFFSDMRDCAMRCIAQRGLCENSKIRDKLDVAPKLDRAQPIRWSAESNRYFDICMRVHSCVCSLRLYRSRESIVTEFQRKFVRLARSVEIPLTFIITTSMGFKFFEKYFLDTNKISWH